MQKKTQAKVSKPQARSFIQVETAEVKKKTQVGISGQTGKRQIPKSYNRPGKLAKTGSRDRV